MSTAEKGSDAPCRRGGDAACSEPARSPAAQAQHRKTLNMQASWPASSTFMDNFTQFADRVNKTTGGRLQIKTSAAGTIVPAFEVTDATHKGVIDGAHTWSGYLIGKHPAAVLFTGGPGGPSAWISSTTSAGSTTAAASS